MNNWKTFEGTRVWKRTNNVKKHVYIFERVEIERILIDANSLINGLIDFETF